MKILTKNILLTLFIFNFHNVNAQTGMTFQTAEKQGIVLAELDAIYKSAVSVDTTKAVFKTVEEQKKWGETYKSVIFDLGAFLKKNNFYWKQKTRCYNRIYFNENGKIDYFLYNFLGADEEKPNEKVQKEFDRLLNLFVKDYLLPININEKLAQCSPVTYMPQNELQTPQK